MAKQNPDNPFNPGPGTLPAHLAGRSNEKSVIEETLKAIVGKRLQERAPKKPTLRPIKLSGPRGAGKTCLMQWAEDLARKQDVQTMRVVHARVVTSRESMLQGIINQLIGNGGDDSAKSTFQMGLLPLVSYKEEWRSDPSHNSYKQALLARLGEGPLAMMLDEVQHYDKEILALILQHNQEMINAGYPLAMMLAGTPKMESYFMDVFATFMNRSETIRINSLSTEETSDALHKPFRDQGIKVSDDALQFMIKQADNYPYFVQVVGRAVWKEAMDAGRRDVDLDLAQQGKKVMEREREIFYDSIYEEMLKERLIPFAQQGAEILAENSNKIRLEELYERLQQRNPGLDQSRALEVAEGLVDWGLLWKDIDWLVPGIPSFASYLKARDGGRSK